MMVGRFAVVPLLLATPVPAPTQMMRVVLFPVEKWNELCCFWCLVNGRMLLPFNEVTWKESAEHSATSSESPESKIIKSCASFS